MQTDYLAPPRFPARKFAVASAVVAGMMNVGVLVLWAIGWIGWVSVLVRLAGVGAVCGGSAWVYGWLMRRAERTPPEQMPWIHACTSSLVVGMILATFGIAWSGTIAGSAIGEMAVWYVPLMFGIALMGGGFGRRVGTSRHCPRCEYEFTFEDWPDDRPPIRCPECGTGWLGRLKQGRKVKSLRMVGIGAGIMVAGLVISQPIFYLNGLAPRVSTPVLTAVLMLGPRGMEEAWGELAKRPMSAEWTRRVAERALVLRHSPQQQGGAGRWLAAQAAAGALPADIVDRFQAETLAAELVVPESVRSGEPFQAAVRVRHLADDFGTSIGVAFAGYGVTVDGAGGGDAALVGREDEMSWAYRLRPGSFQPWKDAFEQPLTIDAPAGTTARVRVVYWVVSQRTFWNDLKWNDDGTLKAPSTTLWKRRVELEKPVRVR